jgi:ABC-type multidrug transport system ATPase subunit
VRIEARGVCKRFGAVLALDDVSFEVTAGRRVALVGPNGSGKSTLNRAMMGLVACQGTVLLDGHSPFRERMAIARRIAYVPQTAPQIATPLGELLDALARVRGIERARIERMARALELDAHALALRPFRSLSGGTKQKILVALAFASGASLLLLDEPTGSLDARARERFFELFASLPAETTLLLCSHRLDEIRPLVDHVLLLQEGRLAYDGEAAAFLARCALSILEVRVDGREAEDWLLARAFRRSPAGVWQRTVDHAEKMKLLAELPSALGARLRNVNARDLEGLDLAPSPAGGAHD